MRKALQKGLRNGNDRRLRELDEVMGRVEGRASTEIVFELSYPPLPTPFFEMKKEAQPTHLESCRMPLHVKGGFMYEWHYCSYLDRAIRVLQGLALDYGRQRCPPPCIGSLIRSRIITLEFWQAP